MKVEGKIPNVVWLAESDIKDQEMVKWVSKVKSGKVYPLNEVLAKEAAAVGWYCAIQYITSGRISSYSEIEGLLKDSLEGLALSVVWILFEVVLGRCLMYARILNV